jgi:tRNA(Ile)-lysidine synthase
MDFEPSLLLPLLRRLPPAQRYLVAFSGGCDSTVLLHALQALGNELPAPLLAVHVDHGLQAPSSRWAAHCAALCAGWQVACECRRVDAHAEAGESREAAARRARYGALAAAMRPGDVLLTAHHRDDQAETFLLQLLRGAGPRGLAAMPGCVSFGKGHLARPLLGFSRAQLCDYARRQGLAWIDDPSNFDTVFDRNYLRNTILPPLIERWPAAPRAIARASTHQAEAALLLDELAAEDLGRLQSGDALHIAGLRALSQQRARNLLRYRIRSLGLPVPDAGRTQRILDEVVNARKDATPRVAWPGAEARRYRDRLFLLPALPPVPADAFPWDGRTPLVAPGLGVLDASDVPGGLDPVWRGARLQVRFGVAGERCRPVGGAHHHSLKKLWQAAGVPPWERERTPLLYVNGVLAAVGTRWICAEFAAPVQEKGWMPLWRPFAIETTCQKDDNLSGPAP